MNILLEDNDQSPNQVKRRFDPNRRERIIEATLETIANYGVSETTLRRVATAANVPLGSLTYHFTGRDDLLSQSFQKFTKQMLTHFDSYMSKAKTVEDAKKIVIAHICGDGWVSQRNLLLSYELCAFSSRMDHSSSILRSWLEGVRIILMRFFDKRTADALDALIEGYSIHRSFDLDSSTREDIEFIVNKIID